MQFVFLLYFYNLVHLVFFFSFTFAMLRIRAFTRFLCEINVQDKKFQSRKPVFCVFRKQCFFFKKRSSHHASIKSAVNTRAYKKVHRPYHIAQYFITYYMPTHTNTRRNLEFIYWCDANRRDVVHNKHFIFINEKLNIPKMTIAHSPQPTTTTLAETIYYICI